jgi:membrane-associated phospholipid phosphatase
MIWEPPGFPSLLVFYAVANDFFFSGHTALAVFGAVELGRFSGRRCRVAAFFIAVFLAGVVLVLRAHYTMDVFAGTVAALCAAVAAKWLAPTVDGAIARAIGLGAPA